MKIFFIIVSFVAITLMNQDVFAEKGCLNLVVEKKLVGKSYSLVFTVKNIGEDVIFEQASLLPWQTNAEAFFTRLVPASNPDKEMIGNDSAVETDTIVALFPRDTLSKEIPLSGRYQTAEDMLQTEDLLYFWSYKPHQECLPQDGMTLLLKLDK
jgi:hypothetical protein